MGPTGCPLTLITNYQLTPRSIPKSEAVTHVLIRKILATDWRVSGFTWCCSVPKTQGNFWQAEPLSSYQEKFF